MTSDRSRCAPAWPAQQGTEPSALLCAESAHAARERSMADSMRPVLAGCPDVASTRAAAAPPAVALPLSDRSGHATWLRFLRARRRSQGLAPSDLVGPHPPDSHDAIACARG